MLQPAHDIGVSVPSSDPLSHGDLVVVAAASTLHSETCRCPGRREIIDECRDGLLQFRFLGVQHRKRLTHGLQPMVEHRPTDGFCRKFAVHRDEWWVHCIGNAAALLRPFQGFTPGYHHEHDRKQKPSHVRTDTTVLTSCNRRPAPKAASLWAKRLFLVGRYFALTSLSTVCSVGCEQAPERPEPIAHQPQPTVSNLATLASAATPPTVNLSSETQRELTQLRNLTLRFVPQEENVRRLEFFGTNLARLTRDALYVGQATGSATNDTWTTKRTLLQTGREIVRLADDSLLVVTTSSTLRFNSDGKPESPLSKVTYFPGMRLWPELRYRNAFATFEPNSATLSLYRWDDPATSNPTETHTPPIGPIFLPSTISTFDGLADSNCHLLLDGSFACIKDLTLFTGWPGHPPKRLGSLAPGATVVRLVPGDRLDRVRVLRSDARLEEYWVVSPPKRLRSISLPWVPFDVVRLKEAFAVLWLEQGSSPDVRFSLSVVEASGKLRWTKPLDVVPSPSSTADFDREVLACRSLAVHPRKPWLAVSNCQSVVLFDAKTGVELAKLPDVRF